MKKDKKFLGELEENLGNINSKYKETIISKYQDIIKEEKAKKRKIKDILNELGDPKEVAAKELEIYKKQSFISKLKVKVNSLFSKNTTDEVKEEKPKKKKKKEEEKPEEVKLEDILEKTEKQEEVKEKEKSETIIEEDKENQPKKKEEKKELTEEEKVEIVKEELEERIKEETKEEKKPIKERVKSFFGVLTKDISFKKKEDNINPKEVVEDVIEDAEDEIADVSEIVPEKKIFETRKARIKRITLKSLGVLLISLLLFVWLWVTVVFLASIFAYLDGVRFIGLVLALFGLDVIVLWIVIMVNRLIFKKPNNIKLNLIIIIVSVVFIALGIVLFVRKLYKVEEVNDVSIKYTMTNKISTYSLPLDPEEKFYVTFNGNYKTQYIINYDETLNEKIKLEVKYFECYYDYYIKKTSNNVYVSLAQDNRDRLSVYIDDLKEGKVFSNDELSRYVVKISIHPDNAERLVIQD